MKREYPAGFESGFGFEAVGFGFGFKEKGVNSDSAGFGSEVSGFGSGFEMPGFAHHWHQHWTYFYEGRVTINGIIQNPANFDNSDFSEQISDYSDSPIIPISPIVPIIGRIVTTRKIRMFGESEKLEI